MLACEDRAAYRAGDDRNGHDGVPAAKGAPPPEDREA